MAPSSRRAERGAALLEALVALTVAVLVGLSAVELVRAILDRTRAAASSERQYEAADRVLTVYATLGRTELDQRIGEQLVGAFFVSVQRPRPSLYRVAVRDGQGAGNELLVTVIQRPETAP